MHSIYNINHGFTLKQLNDIASKFIGATEIRAKKLFRTSYFKAYEKGEILLYSKCDISDKRANARDLKYHERQEKYDLATMVVYNAASGLISVEHKTLHDRLESFF